MEKSPRLQWTLGADRIEARDDEGRVRIRALERKTYNELRAFDGEGNVLLAYARQRSTLGELCDQALRNLLWA
jgi:hypothetical protein